MAKELKIGAKRLNIIILNVIMYTYITVIYVANLVILITFDYLGVKYTQIQI